MPDWPDWLIVTALGTPGLLIGLSVAYLLHRELGWTHSLVLSFWPEILESIVTALLASVYLLWPSERAAWIATGAAMVVLPVISVQLVRRLERAEKARSKTRSPARGGDA